MTRRKKYFYLFSLALLASAFYFRPQIEDIYLKSRERIDGFKEFAQNLSLENIEKNVSAPPPLRSEKESPNAILSQAGTIRWTNINRKNNDLDELKENQLLNQAARKKADDMFEKQYFEHVSPSGKGPQDLAEAADYEYISIGENLALGNFANDQELLDAWMASPGHRENILNKGFTEIGVAVVPGRFEGKNVWIAVQEFGAPLSICTSVDSFLKSTIDSNNKNIDALSEELKSRREDINDSKPSDPRLAQKINDYNELVKDYNALIAKTKDLVQNYNGQVTSFNKCVKENTR